MKQRYSDFVVREVSREGQVIYLNSIDGSELEAKYFPPKGEARPCTPEEISSFLDTLTAKGWLTDPVIKEQLHNYLMGCLDCDESLENELVTFSCSSKEERGYVHQLIKNHLSNIIIADTVFIGDQQHIRLKAKFKLKKGRDNRQESARWPPGKDYLRFTLLKENVVGSSKYSCR